MQNHFSICEQTWRSDAPNCNAFKKSAPRPPNISDEHVSCTAPATRNAFLQVLFKCHTLANGFGTATKPSRFVHFLPRCRILCTCHTKMTLQRAKMVRACGVLSFWFRHVLRATAPKNVHFHHVNFQKWFEIARKCTSTCASCHNGVHFFDHKSLEKQCFATLLPFRAPTFSFFWFFFFSLLWLFPPLLFHLPILSEIWLLNFFRKLCHSQSAKWIQIDVLECLWKHALAGKVCLWFVSFQFCKCMIHPQRLAGAQQSATEQFFGPLPALVLVGQRCRRKRSANLKRMQSHWVQRSCSQVRLSLDLPSDKTMVMLETPKNRKDDVRVPQITRCTLNLIY